jgi:hypothetical protein
MRHRASPLISFYAQAAATARYLYEARDGNLRQSLFDFLRAYYTGDRAHLDLAKTLGVDPDELGSEVVSHARKVIADL